MKGRGLFFLLGLLLGLLLGFGAGQEEIRMALKDGFLRYTGKVDEGIQKLVRKVKKEPEAPAIATNRPAASAASNPGASPEDKANYIRKFIQLEEIAAKVDFASATFAVVSGKVKNSGPRALQGVGVTVYFLGSDTIVFESNMPAVRETPLEPGASCAFTNTVRNVPESWVKGRVRASATDVAF